MGHWTSELVGLGIKLTSPGFSLMCRFLSLRPPLHCSPLLHSRSGAAARQLLSNPEAAAEAVRESFFCSVFNVLYFSSLCCLRNPGLEVASRNFHSNENCSCFGDSQVGLKQNHK